MITVSKIKTYTIFGNPFSAICLSTYFSTPFFRKLCIVCSVIIRLKWFSFPTRNLHKEQLINSVVWTQEDFITVIIKPTATVRSKLSQDPYSPFFFDLEYLQYKLNRFLVERTWRLLLHVTKANTGKGICCLSFLHELCHREIKQVLISTFDTEFWLLYQHCTCLNISRNYASLPTLYKFM